MFFKVAGREIYGLALGNGSRNLLLHSGWIGTWEDWQPQIESLSQKYRVVGYDHRGAGYTESKIEDINLEGLVDDIFGVMDSLGMEKCVLGGFSSGIRVALLAALKHPERFEGLVLMCGSNPTLLNRSPDKLAGFTQMLSKNYEATIWQTILGFTPEPNVEHIRYFGYRLLKKSNSEQAVRIMEVLNEAIITEEQLQTISLPTLLIHGSIDNFGPVSAGEYMQSQLPNSQLVVVEGGGHVCALTKPDEVTTAIDNFLAGLTV